MGKDSTRSVGLDTVETDIPARLDRLPWGRFHTLVIVALGITWILDGLEVTLAGRWSGALKESPTLRFTNTDIGLAGSAYLAGAVLGAIFFGWLTDRLGRKKLFFITLAVYLTATRRHRLLLESSGALPVPLLHRRRHRRRVHGHQFHDPGAHPGARARLDRSRHQRQLLGRRGARGRRFDRPARSRRLRARHGMARRVLHRRCARPRDPVHAAVDSRKPALADDAWPGEGGARRSWPASRRVLCAPAPSSSRGRCRGCGCARARIRRSARSSAPCSPRTGSAPWSG